MENDLEPERRRHKILIVDDDAAARTMLSRLLETTGEVLLASSGDEALRMIDLEQPRLMILDMVMPGMSGLEVLRAVRAGPRPMMILVLTGANDMDLAKRALEAGADEYVTKPFDLIRMREKVVRTLGKNRATVNNSSGLPWRTVTPDSTAPSLKLNFITRSELKAMIDRRQEFHLWNVSTRKQDGPESLIAGSRWITFESITPELAAEAVGTSREAIVLYGAGPESSAVRAAVAKLQSYGYENVYCYEGGILDWSENGLPLGKSPQEAGSKEIK